MEQENSGTKLIHIASLLQRYWLTIVAAVVVSTLLAWGYSMFQPRIYAAQSSGLVVTSGTGDIGTALAGDSLAKSKANSYKSIAISMPVAERVSKALNIDDSAEALLAKISVDVPQSSNEIRVTAQAESPALARDLADAWVQALAAEALSVETSASEANDSAVQVSALGKAALPTSPVSPNTKLILAIGVLFGLLVGVSVVFIRSSLDRRIRSVEAIQQLGVGVVGTIPVEQRLTAERSIIETGVLTQNSSETHAFTESLRELRTNLSYMDVDNPPRVIVVTSSVPGEGKSSLAANLAVTLAATGRPTILIDADLRRPVVTDLFGLPSGAGLTDVLSGSATLEEVAQFYAPVPALMVLGSGRIPPNPSELLGSKAMKSLLEELSRDLMVIIDCPPLLPVTDAAILTKVADGALVTVRAGSTRLDELQRSLEILENIEGNLLGVILNAVPITGLGASQYGYYGKYYYSSVTDDPSPAQDAATSATTSEVDRPVSRGRRLASEPAPGLQSPEVTVESTSEEASATSDANLSSFDDLVSARVNRRIQRDR